MNSFKKVKRIALLLVVFGLVLLAGCKSGCKKCGDDQGDDPEGSCDPVTIEFVL